MKKIDFINSWKSNAKKNKWSFCVRLWKLTLIEASFEDKKLRLMLLNFGFQI